MVVLCVGIGMGLAVNLWLGPWEQLLVTLGIYMFSYFSFIFCECLIRRAFRGSTHSTDEQSGYFSLGLFEIHSEHKRACLAVLFVVIAGTGYFGDYLEFDAADCLHLGHGLYHIASAIALTFWYWSLVGEQWIFKGNHRGSTSCSADSEADNPSISDHLHRHHQHHDCLDLGSLTVIEEDVSSCGVTPNSGSLCTETAAIGDAETNSESSMRRHVRTDSCFSNEHAVEIKMELIDSEIMRIAGQSEGSQGTLSLNGHTLSRYHCQTGGGGAYID